jgi:hypothetical protein
MKPCDARLRFKAKEKGVSHKPTTSKATKAGERLFMDTTGPYEMSAGGTKYNVHVVDQHSEMGWFAHVAQRSTVPKIFEQHCEVLNGKGMPVKQLHCDNAGEHQTKLIRACERHCVNVEYTPPYTLQMNGVVERQIASTNRSTFTMLKGGKFNEKFSLRLRAEAKTTSNKLRNLYVTAPEKPSAYISFHNKQSKLLSEHWREYGRVGYVTDCRTIERKGAQRGKPMIMVGYADDYPADCY